ncbi:unnamed protein product [Hanseniaspora opuntiae]
MDKVFNQTFAQTHKDIEFPKGNLEVVYPALDQPVSPGSQLKAKEVQETPSVKVSSSLIKKDALYTLIMSDIDASAEGCHYLVTNSACCPRIEQNHAYVWLLFEGVPEASKASAVNECRRGYGTNEKYHGAEWFKEVSGLGQLIAFNYQYVKNDLA